MVTAAKPISSPVPLLALRRCSGSSRDSRPRRVQDAGGGLRDLPQHGGQHQRQLRGVAALCGGAALLRVLQQPQRAVPPHADPRPARPGEGHTSHCSLLLRPPPALRPRAKPGAGLRCWAHAAVCPLCAGHTALQPLVRVMSVPAAGRAGAVQQLGTVTTQSYRTLSSAAAPRHSPSCRSRRPCLLR